MIESKLFALIVDSDTKSVTRTTKLLQKNPLVNSISSAKNSDEALFRLIDNHLNLVFLEFPPKGNVGNELLKFLKSKSDEISVVYLSEDKLHAMDAIRDGVFTFIHKPVQQEILTDVLDKISFEKENNANNRIKQAISQTSEDLKLRIQTKKGYLLIKPDEIIYCKADGFYTELFLTEKRTELCYILLSKMQQMLESYQFIRVSRSILINEKYLRRIYRGDNTIVLSYNGQEFEVKGSKLFVRNLSKMGND